MPVSTNSTKKASSSSRSKTKQAEIVMEQQLDVAEFANNSHHTEYTQMMHRYAELDKREKCLKTKNRALNVMLFISVILMIGCIIGTAVIYDAVKYIG
mgnify:CR=1 FL=1